MVLLVHFGVYLLYVKHLVLGTLCIRSFEAVWFFSGLHKDTSSREGCDFKENKEKHCKLSPTGV